MIENPLKDYDQLTDFEQYAIDVHLTDEQLKISTEKHGGTTKYFPKTLNADRIKRHEIVVLMLREGFKYPDIHRRTGLSERRIRQIEQDEKQKRENK